MNRIFIFELIFLFTAFVQAKTVGDALEVSRQNLKGHKALYNQGWFVVTSTKESIEFGRKKSIAASKAMSLAITNISSSKQELGKKLSELKQSTSAEADEFNKSGTDQTKNTFNKTNEVAKNQWNFSKEKYSKAFSAFTLGYLEFGQKSKNDWEKLKQVNRDFLKRTQQPFDETEKELLMSNTYKIAEKKSDEAIWSKAFSVANDEFNKSYEESGEKENSLQGLGSVVWGYLKYFYYGLLKPSAETANLAAQATVDGARNAGPYLIAGLIAGVKITGDTVYTTGLNIYYTTKLGYNVFSPTVEGGLLGSMALASSASVPVIYVSGSSLGVINQVAVTAATPVVGSGQFILASTAETAKHSATMTYDFAKGTGLALAHESTAMVVLGYNMLTAIPAQVLLGAANGVVFLVYDGPHLALVTLRGEIDGVPVSEIPVGTIIDGKVIENSGIKSEKITTDPNIIQKVLEAAPADLSIWDNK